jgi:hypothetical protein
MQIGIGWTYFDSVVLVTLLSYRGALETQGIAAKAREAL